MANNPLYPGYVLENEESGASPIFPGYFAGKPLVRKPVSRDFIQPIAYSSDEFLSYLNTLDATASNIPNWVKDRIVDDYKQFLKAGYLPSGATMDTIDDYVQDNYELPGASGTSVSLDFAAYAADPKKEVTDLVKGWVKTVTGVDVTDLSRSNFGDFEERVKRTVWMSAVRDEVAGVSAATGMATFGPAAQSYIERLTGQDIEKGKNPIALMGASTPAYAAKEYKAFADTFTEYSLNRAAVIRGIKFDAVAGAMFDAVHAEHWDSSTGVNAVRASLGLDPVATKAARIMHHEYEIMQSINGVVDSFDGVNKALNKFNNGAVNINGKPAHEVVKAKLAAFQKTLADPATGGALNKLDSAIDRVRKIDPDAAARLEKRYAGYRQYLETVTPKVNKLAGVDLTINAATNIGQSVAQLPLKAGRQIQGRAMQQEILNSRGGRVFGIPSSGGTLQELRRNALKEIQDDLVYRKDDPTSIGYLIRARGEDGFARRVAFYAKYVGIDMRTKEVSDTLDAITGGKYLTLFLWNPKIKPLIEKYTPAGLLASTLEKVHYFGLKIDDDTIAEFVGPKTANSALFKFLYGYKFDLGLKKVRNIHDFGISALGGISGGEHFKVITGIQSLFGEYSKGAPLTAGQKMILTLVRDGNLSDPALVTSVARLLSAAKGEKVSASDAADIIGHAGNFRKWFAAYAAKNGRKFKPGTDFNDDLTMLALVRALMLENTNKDSLAITKKFAGFVDYSFVVLNRLQTAFMSNPLVGNFLRIYFSGTTILANKISSLLSRFVLKYILGSASGGLLLFASPLFDKFITPLLNVLLKKTFDTFSNFLGGLLKGDIFGFVDQIEKELTNAIKACLVVTAIPVTIVVLVLSLFTGSVASSTPIVDPTRSASAIYFGGEGLTWPVGENLLVKVEKDVFVNGQKNPESPIPNEQLTIAGGVAFYYEVTITPKVTIRDASVTYEDKTVVRWSDGSSETLHSVGSTRIGADGFQNGVPITFRIPQSGEFRLASERYKDTLVTNTVYVNLPAVNGYSTDPMTVAFSRSFRIGDYVSECPLVGDYVRSTISFTNDSIGHGTTGYWEGVCGDNDNCICNYPIPWIYREQPCKVDGEPYVTGDNMCAPSYSGNICYDEFGDGVEEYGSALDVSPTGASTSGTYDVVLPALGDANRTWNLYPNGYDACYPNYGGSWGYGVKAISSDGQYKLYFTHMAADVDCRSQGVRAGTKIGTLYTGWSSSQIHLHIELIDMASGSTYGTPLRPEDYMCSR